jgi:rhamnosyltransferase
MKNDVLVMLQAYNGENWIMEQIDSILNQTYNKIDILINIDTSEDNTYKIIFENYINNDNIIINNNIRRYGSATKNFIQSTLNNNFDNYKYIAISDQDDIWDINKIERALAVINQFNCDGYSSNIKAFWDSGRIKKIKKSYKQVEFDYLCESPGPGCTFVMTKKLYDSLRINFKKNEKQLFKIGGGEYDWYIYIFARSNGFNWIIDSSYTMMYRQHSNNSVGANIGLKAKLERIKTILSTNMFLHSLDLLKIANIKENSNLYDKKKGINYYYLIKNFYKFRRNPIDKIIFLFVIFYYKIKKGFNG